MTVTVVVVGVAAILLVVGMAVRGRRGPKATAGDTSGLRDAFVGILMAVGPFFGVRYRPPRVEIPVVMTPAGEDLDPATAPRPPGEAPHDDGGPAG